MLLVRVVYWMVRRNVNEGHRRSASASRWSGFWCKLGGRTLEFEICRPFSKETKQKEKKPKNFQLRSVCFHTVGTAQVTRKSCISQRCLTERHGLTEYAWYGNAKEFLAFDGSNQLDRHFKPRVLHYFRALYYPLTFFSQFFVWFCFV